MKNRQIITIATTTVITVTMILSSSATFFDFSAMGEPVWGPAGEKKCTYDFFSRTCCWMNSEGGVIQKRCETCIAVGDGTYDHCKIKDGPVVDKDPSTPPKPPKGNIDGTRAPINEGVLDQSFSSEDNNDNTGESNNAEIGTISENPSQESSSSSETSSSEQTTNFAKKGGTQNSPVPPECPKQGPIPPDCTMKPKF